MNMARRTYYKRPNARCKEAVRKPSRPAVIEDILAEFPSYGTDWITQKLRRRGRLVNHRQSLTCHAGALTHAPPRTRMARHDEQQAQAGRRTER